MARVKKCPVCGVNNDPLRVQCACGGSLARVSLTELATATAESLLRCPESQCGHLNPADATHCIYCFSPLVCVVEDHETDEITSAANRVTSGSTLDFPWGDVEVGNMLAIGRDKDFSILADRLASFTNVSRRHAILSYKDNALVLTDVGSMNGTFVNGTKICIDHPTILKNGDVIRFALDLTSIVRTETKPI